jgi:hypothetical protein
MRLAGETRLGNLFGARIAAASVTGKREEIQAVVAALIQERDAALKYWSNELQAAERCHVARVRLQRQARRSARRRLAVERNWLAQALPIFRTAKFSYQKKRALRRSRPIRSNLIRSTLLWRLSGPTI